MKWNWNKEGGTAGTYELDKWKIFCNGDVWITENPQGHRYSRVYKTIASAKKFAEEKMGGKK